MKRYFTNSHIHQATPGKRPDACLRRCIEPFLVIPSMMIVCLYLNMGFVAYASPDTHMTVNIGSKLVSCDVQIRYDQKHMTKVLREGGEMNISWEINVGEHRKYWFRRKVAMLDIKRRVIPDLVSQSWLLVDITSGISQRVFNVDRAIQFLTHLEHFPVIDRSLLTEGHRYRVDITVDEIEGEEHRGWISTWFGSSRVATSAEFTLP